MHAYSIDTETILAQFCVFISCQGKHFEHRFATTVIVKFAKDFFVGLVPLFHRYNVDGILHNRKLLVFSRWS